MDAEEARGVGRGGAATAESVAEQIDRLAQVYEFREPEEVRTYLAENPDLLPLVAEAAGKIPDFVMPDEQLVLEVVWDPEDEGDQGQLFALVPTYLKHQQVLPRLHRLTREWLIDAGRSAIGRFNVNVEFR